MNPLAKSLLVALLATAPVSVPVAVCCALYGAPHDAPRYQMVATLRGDSFVLDTNQTADDCRAALVDERAHWGTDVAFRCEREG